MFGMMRRLLLIVSLAMLFGLGQQGAAVHAISHLADQRQESQQHNKKSHQLSFCDQCAAYANLGSAIDAEVADFACLAGHSILSIAGAPLRLSGHNRHYSARAPPALA